MDSNTTLNTGNGLLITWVNKPYKIEDRYLPSIHFWDIGPFCRDYYLVLFLLFFFSFSFIFLLVLLSSFKFCSILCCICCFLSYFCYRIYYQFISLFIPHNPLSQKCAEGTNSFILLFLQTYMKTHFTFLGVFFLRGHVLTFTKQVF